MSVVDAFKYQVPAELKTLIDAVLSPITFTNTSGTAGAATAHTYSGKSAVAASASSVVITNNLVGTNSVVLAVVSQASADGTLLYVARVVPAAGSFTVYGNTTATADTVIRWVVIR